TVAKIDPLRVYPIVIPRASYAAVAMIVVLVGLNFFPLSLNHNWFALSAAPEINRSETVKPRAGTKFMPNASLLQDISKDTANLPRVYAGLQEIAVRLKESDTLRGVSQALMDKRLALAAEELRTA